ncbi:MAG: PEP-CTERM sorting domain-containing protein [Verrucomicrobiota bacterium]
MKIKPLAAFSVLGLMLGYSAHAATITIDNLDVRATGVFGQGTNVSAVTINGSAPGGTVVADPINVQMTYSNLDLDGDSSANDSVTFTLTVSKFGTDGGSLRAFNQGFDTGFGNLNDVSVTVSSVSGTTTDSGATIVFDGFTAAEAGFGGNGDLDSTVEINGTVVSVNSPNTGAFQFLTQGVSFAPTSTVTFDNSVRNGIGTIVARNYDLQFSTVDPIPEPSSVGLLGLASGLLFFRRRK